MANTTLVTTSFGVDAGKLLVEEIQSGVPYYIFAAKHTPYLNNSDQTISEPTESVQNGMIQIYNDMIFGKKVQTDDVCSLITRNDWTSNTVYAMYDDTDGNLMTENFFVSVNVGSYTNVYKCLYNSQNTASITEPSGTDDKPFVTPSDGYIWKYMYTANDYVTGLFSSQNYIPVTANTQVTANAIPGAIDVIAVDDPGGGYSNYISDSFGSSDLLRINGNPYLYGLGTNASTIDNFYNGCMILMTSGSAKNEYRIITDYYVQNGQKVIVLNDTFVNTVSATDSYEITPYVYVFDTGTTKQTNCMARAIINPVGNTVKYVDILEPGIGYREAQALIIQDASVPVTANSSLRPIMSPPGGHGFDVLNELGSKSVGITVKFIEDESPFTTQNDYRTVGLLRNPQFANVSVKYDETKSVGVMLAGETVYQYKPVTLAGSVSVYSNTTVKGNNTQFTSALSNNDQIIITNGQTNMYVTAVNVIDDETITIDSNATLTDDGCNIQYVRDAKPIGKMSGNTAGYIQMSNVYAFSTDVSPHILGATSSATYVIDVSANSDLQVTVQGRSADSFAKFNQLSSLMGIIEAGPAFQADEVLFQAASIPEANATSLLHSYVDANSGPYDTLYITNSRNVFETIYSTNGDGVIIGETSGAYFTLYNTYQGDLIPDTGNIVYLENLAPITRSNTKTETIKLTVSF